MIFAGRNRGALDGKVVVATRAVVVIDAEVEVVREADSSLDDVIDRRYAVRRLAHRLVSVVYVAEADDAHVAAERIRPALAVGKADRSVGF